MNEIIKKVIEAHGDKLRKYKKNYQVEAFRDKANKLGICYEIPLRYRHDFIRILWDEV